MANHKRRRPKHRRAGCLLCKPNRLTANKKADGARARRECRRREEAGGCCNFFMMAGDPYRSGIAAVADQATGRVAGYQVCGGGTAAQKLWENDDIRSSAGMNTNYKAGHLYTDDRQLPEEAQVPTVPGSPRSARAMSSPGSG